MDRDVMINAIADLIQSAFNAEPRDGKFEKTYNVDSPFRFGADFDFKHLMHLMQLDVMDPSEGSENHYNEHKTAAQWFVDVALQLIARRLLNLFGRQNAQRNAFERHMSSIPRSFVTRDDMRASLLEEKTIAREIELWKTGFHELLELAKRLEFEVFERDVYQYQVYYMLKLKRR